jgi:RNA polymerase sigma-70 factor (ECF subfamily)
MTNPPLAPGADAVSSAVVAAHEEFVRGLYDQYKPQLQAFVMRFTGDAHWAEDIVQTTFIRAWQARPSLTVDPAAVRSWLYTVAYHVFVDEYRSRSMRPVKLTAVDVAPSDPGDSEEDRLVDTITLIRALAKLSEAHRQAIAYVYYMNLTVDEAALRLGVPSGTVKSRLYHGVRALRRQLAPAVAYQRPPPSGGPPSQLPGAAGLGSGPPPCRRCGRRRRPPWRAAARMTDSARCGDCLGSPPSGPTARSCACSSPTVVASGAVSRGSWDTADCMIPGAVPARRMLVRRSAGPRRYWGRCATYVLYTSSIHQSTDGDRLNSVAGTRDKRPLDMPVRV